MSALSSRKGLLALLGLLVVVLAFRYWPGAPVAEPAPPRPSASGAGARKGGAPLAPSEIPPLAFHQERGEIGGDVVRNVFAFHVPPTPTPRPAPPVPTPVPAPGAAGFIGPRLPTPTPSPTPIVAPAIPFKALGVFGPRDRPIVTFEDGPRLINAREGDVLDGRFILKRVGRESVDFAFVGLPPEITKRIPVLPPDALR
jgi:hypothetical protein